MYISLANPGLVDEYWYSALKAIVDVQEQFKTLGGFLNSEVNKNFLMNYTCKTETKSVNAMEWYCTLIRPRKV